MRDWLAYRTETIGFVPTMGALHAGHVSLLGQSKKEAGITIASIYVNPVQFNDPDDFEQYPKTLEADLKLLDEAGCDAVYLPSTTDIYPEGMGALLHYDLGSLENFWEGEHRPGHFQGVCAVVHRLLDAVSPHFLYMGLKDYQQVAVVRRLIAITSLPVKLVGCPTIRDEDGLALSSRNARLNTAQRKQAGSIYEGFMRQLSPHEFEQFLLEHGFEKVDYIACCDPLTLEPVYDHKPCLMLVAAWIGAVRLIDNYFIS